MQPLLYPAPTNMRYQLLFCLATCAALVSCRKDDTPAPSGGGTPWMSHIAVAVDSAFILAPNVVTPNHDGINDVFHAYGRNVTAMSTMVMFLNGEPAFSSTSLYPVWADLDSTDLGRYRVIITATSTSGVVLSATSYLDVIDYGTSTCLPFQGLPVTGDQLDPRLFGVTYGTQDVFCE
jgi:hypothetical protein